MSKSVRFAHIETVNNNRRIRISDRRMPRGYPIRILPGWQNRLAEGARIRAVDNSGNIFISNGQFSPLAGSGQNHRGSIIGSVVRYNSQHEEVGSPFVVPLGAYKFIDQVEHVNRTIEILPAGNLGKLTVVERRTDAKGLPEDSAAHLYAINREGLQLIKDNIRDLNWITDISIVQQSSRADAVISFRIPDGTVKQLTIPGNLLKDNEGKTLLNNKSAGITSTEDIYQSNFYTGETFLFRPRLADFEGRGNLRIVVHKVDRYTIDAPAELAKTLKHPDGTIKIFPSTAASAIQVGKRWIPLSITEALTHTEMLNLGEEGLSQIWHGIIKSAIGPQTRFGNIGEISGEYPRDPFFYGLQVFTSHAIREKYGDTSALNRAKSLRAGRGIQSGRTHVMTRDLLENMLFADVMETNNQNYSKVSNYANWLWGPGVSEDTQMEIASWILGARMHVLKKVVALMSAEKEWGRYKVQNTERYDYSEELFRTPFRLVIEDIIKGRLMGTKPTLMKWAEMSEITAGRTWYKKILGQIMETSAIPVYLASFGYVFFYPVDVLYFMGSWFTRTFFSSVNYILQLTSIGYGSKDRPWNNPVNFMKDVRDGLSTGFWNNPSIELTFAYNYFKGAMEQFLMRHQYATFVSTVSGGGQGIPKINKAIAQGGMAVTGAAIARYVAYLALGGIDPMLTEPALAIAPVANLGFGAYQFAVFANSYKFMQKYGQRRAPQRSYSSTGEPLTSIIVKAKENLFADILGSNPKFSFAFNDSASNVLRIKGKMTEHERDALLALFPGKKKKEQRDAIRDMHDASNEEASISFAEYTEFSAIARRSANDLFGLSYTDLFSQRETLMKLLEKLGAMTVEREFSIGFDNPNRDLANQMLELYSTIEMAICLNATRDLRKDRKNLDAMLALKRILTETREYIVMRTAEEMFAQLGL